MKNFFTLLLLVTCTATTLCQTNGKITRIIDGDTYIATINGIEYRCRLENVDCPERDQFMGLTIKDSVNCMLLNKPCRIEIHGQDQYRRKVVKINIEGKNLDSILIARGWAWYHPVRTRSVNEKYSSSENISRLFTLGIWRCQFNIQPWIWRKLKKFDKLKLRKSCK